MRTEAERSSDSPWIEFRYCVPVREGKGTYESAIQKQSEEDGV